MTQPSRAYTFVFYFMLALAAVCFAFFLNRLLPPRMMGTGIGLLAVAVAIFALLVVFFYVRQRSYTGNRMARLIGAGDFAEAIRVGEDALRKKRDYVTVFNLASAYAQSGQRQKAAELLPELEANAFGQKFATPETEQQFLDRLRAAINPKPDVAS